jgi:polar amino acid transport system substrate-binding protein
VGQSRWLIAAAVAMATPIGRCLRAVLGAAFAVSALTGPASTAAPLQLVTDQLLPFENLSDAEAPGFSTEVLREVFAAMGQKASFEEFPWPRALRLVFRGERDALFTALYNDERGRFCYFPNEPLLREKWVFFIRVSDVGRLKFLSLDDLVGHDIAVQRGAAVSPEFWNFVRQNRNFSETGSGEANFRMLEAGRVDYAVSSISQGMRLIGSLGLNGKVQPLLSRSLKEDDMYVIFSKERVSPAFVAAVSDALHQFKQTEAFRAIQGNISRTLLRARPVSRSRRRGSKNRRRFVSRR